MGHRVFRKLVARLSVTHRTELLEFAWDPKALTHANMRWTSVNGWRTTRRPEIVMLNTWIQEYARLGTPENDDESASAGAAKQGKVLSLTADCYFYPMGTENGV